jgi:large subunit ribosomal protein L14
MIQVQTKLKAIDNSGARYVQCIRALGGFNRTFAYNGDTVVVSIKELKLIRKVKVSEIYLGIIARTKKESKYKDGLTSKFGSNSIILLNKKKRVLGTRLFG